MLWGRRILPTPLDQKESDELCSELLSGVTICDTAGIGYAANTAVPLLPRVKMKRWVFFLFEPVAADLFLIDAFHIF